jgi:hypothetical protein
MIEERDNAQLNGQEADTTGAEDTSSVEGNEAAPATDNGNQGNEQENTASEKGPEDFLGNVPQELAPLKKELLQAFYKKTQDLSVERKNVEAIKSKADMLEQLYAYPKFREWYEKEQKILNGQGDAPEETNLSADEIEELKSDPVKFQKYLMDQLERKIDSRMGNDVKSTKAELAEIKENMEIEKEFKETSSRFPDFEDVTSAGLLDDYIEKGYSYSEAYKMYKFDSQSNPERVNRAKNGTVVKPSPIHANGAEAIIKGKNFDDVFDRMFAAKAEGKKARYSNE